MKVKSSKDNMANVSFMHILRHFYRSIRFVF